METPKVVTIPNHWTLPKYSFAQRTKQGVIVGIQYYLFHNLLAPERDGLWLYAVLVSTEDDQVEYLGVWGSLTIRRRIVFGDEKRD
ncbi:hypothetical protein [Nostoc sp.]|uniref:hypothetical protein n=1 Tax=Nostoc sp. TaxID=1180 RepID=UPI002FF770EF